MKTIIVSYWIQYMSIHRYSCNLPLVTVAEYPKYPGTESCDGILLNVGCLHIIYVPTHGHLGTIYQFIGHTWVIWVHFEPFPLQMPPEFLVKQHGTSQHTVDSFG